MSFLKSFIENAGKFPNKTAIEFIDPPFQRYTYAELDQLIDHTAGYLSGLGLNPGDRLALQLSKSIEFILLHMATVRLGAITLPLNLSYPPDELKYFLEDSSAKLFFALESSKAKIDAILPRLPELTACIYLDPSNPINFHSLITKSPSTFIRETVSVYENDTAVILYTSGTTGRPKGAEITHGNLISNFEALHEIWGWKSDDVLLHVLPIFHVHGLFVALHGALHAGASTKMMREFNAERALTLLSNGDCTVFMGVPTIHKRLLNAADSKSYDLSRVRLITSGSDRLPDDLFTKFQSTFGYTLLERYGMTETGMNCSNPFNGERRIGSVGHPLPGVEVRIVDPDSGASLPFGEIGDVQLRGPNIFKGYWRQKEKTLESFTTDGWFKTGDLGFREEDGYITLCGRSKDLIISGGLNVYPPEVERTLLEHPSVNSCAVIGCPDDEWGERVVAVVVLQDREVVMESELIDFCRHKIAPYKCPKAIVFKDLLPRNAMGKIQKALLRSEICN